MKKYLEQKEHEQEQEEHECLLGFKVTKVRLAFKCIPLVDMFCLCTKITLMSFHKYFNYL
jgi:cytochrome c oxidase assembly protein Cox11